MYSVLYFSTLGVNEVIHVLASHELETTLRPIGLLLVAINHVTKCNALDLVQ